MATLCMERNRGDSGWEGFNLEISAIAAVFIHNAGAPKRAYSGPRSANLLFFLSILAPIHMEFLSRSVDIDFVVPWSRVWPCPEPTGCGSSWIK